MAKKGRKPQVDKKTQSKLFKKYAQNLHKPNVKYNDPIFTVMAEELGAKMTPIALFMSFKKYCKNSVAYDRDDVIQIEDQTIDDMSADDGTIIVSEDISLSASRSSLNSTPTITVSKDAKTKSSGQSKIFSIDIDIHDFKKITPITACKKRKDNSFRKYQTLPKYKWSDMIKQKIWQNSKLRCTWILKKSKIQKDYIKLKGHCRQCSAQIEISTLKNTEKIQTLLCSIQNIQKSIKHKAITKSKLTPYTRKQIAKKLKFKPAIWVRHEMASKLITEDHENIDPPVLPTISALRQIKSEAKIEELFDANPLTSLMIMAKTSDYVDTIRDIHFHPHFHIYYWTNKEVEYYNLYYKKFDKVTLTVDATGSFCETIYLPDGTRLTKTLFLYAGLITDNQKLKSVPVLQMVTDSHKATSISSWLKEWANSVANVPHETITDDSSALLSAITLAFTSHNSTKDYIHHVFAVLEGKTATLPATFIRLDNSHFIKRLHTLSCFKDGLENRIKYFYIRCILMIKKCEEYDVAKQIIEDIVKVCLGQYNDSDISAKAKTTEAKTHLDSFTDVIDDGTNTTAAADDIKDIFENKNVEDDELDITESIELITWFDHLVDSNKKNMIENNANSYYYPPFLSTLKRLLYKLPLWSNLLCPFFNSQNKAPSSTAVESYFKTLKKLIFKTKISRHRIDQFIKIHLENLDGEIKIALSDLGQDVTNKRITIPKISRKRKSKNRLQAKTAKLPKYKSHQRFPKDSIFSDEPSFSENWRGQNVEVANSGVEKNVVKFLINGNLCNSICKDENQIKLMNTCALDSVFFLLSLGYKTNQSIKKSIDLLKNVLIAKYIQNLSDSRSSHHDLHEMRSHIALEHFNKIQESNVVNIDCACNSTFIFENVLSNSMFSAVFSKLCLNYLCKSNVISRKVILLPTNIDIIKIFGISSLEDAICIADENNTCVSCKNQANSNYELSNFISFDLNGTDKVNLKDIPETINVKGKCFKLLGVTEFVPAVGLGHYKGHGFVNGHMICYDDLMLRFYNSREQPIYVHTLSYVLAESNFEE